MITIESQDLLSVSLIKWPGLVVSGEPISPDDAAEILIRTDGSPLVYSMSCNDRRWCRMLGAALGLEPEDYGDPPEVRQRRWKERDDMRAALGCLNLSYLSNHQIASSWIGGPHGWCSWDGSIGCSTFNIGKWPSVGDVLEEWGEIASAFPALTLTCHLLDQEIGGETEGVPVVEFCVSGGDVILRRPTNFSKPPERDLESLMTRRMLHPHGERGCTIEQFKHALEVVRARREAQS